MLPIVGSLYIPSVEHVAYVHRVIAATPIIARILLFLIVRAQNLLLNSLKRIKRSHVQKSLKIRATPTKHFLTVISGLVSDTHKAS